MRPEIFGHSSLTLSAMKSVYLIVASWFIASVLIPVLTRRSALFARRMALLAIVGDRQAHPEPRALMRAFAADGSAICARDLGREGKPEAAVLGRVGGHERLEDRGRLHAHARTIVGNFDEHGAQLALGSRRHHHFPAAEFERV